MGAPSDASDLSSDFYAAWVAAFNRLGIHPMYPLRACMFESACWAQAHNANGNAVGLIQFMPSTLKGLGYTGTWSDFLKLDALDQVPWVEKYFAPHAKDINSAALCYVTVFTPANTRAAAAHGADYVLTSDNDHGAKFASAYYANTVFDTAKKGWIAVSDLSAAIARADKGTRWTNIQRNMKAAISEAGGDPNAGDTDPPPGTPAIQQYLATQYAALPASPIPKLLIGGAVLGLIGYTIMNHNPFPHGLYSKKAKS